LLPFSLEHGIAVIAGGVFNSGILADTGPGAHYNYRPASPELLERARRIKAMCERHGVDLKAAALQFPFRHPAITSVLIGCRSVTELEENARVFESPIPDELWDELAS
jgi:D-threo-aldose 1-dehydrogenase